MKLLHMWRSRAWKAEISPFFFSTYIVYIIEVIWVTHIRYIRGPDSTDRDVYTSELNNIDVAKVSQFFISDVAWSRLSENPCNRSIESEWTRAGESQLATWLMN